MDDRRNGYNCALKVWYELTYHLECDTCGFTGEFDKKSVAHKHALEHETTYPTHTIRLIEA